MAKALIGEGEQSQSLGSMTGMGLSPGPCLGGLLLSEQLVARLWSPTGIVLPAFSSLGSIG